MINDCIIKIQSHIIYFRKLYYIDCDLEKKSKPSLPSSPKP